MKTPKILPWLARRYGVSDARAGKLWMESLRHAAGKTGTEGTSEYWKTALERWVELLQAEADQSCHPPLAWMARAHARFWMLPLIAWQGTALVGVAAWTRLAELRRLRVA